MLVTATIEAWAEAAASAHVHAVSSSAVVGCSCGCLTDAVADTFTDASVYVKMLAEVVSTATATACLDGSHALYTPQPLLHASGSTLRHRSTASCVTFPCAGTISCSDHIIGGDKREDELAAVMGTSLKLFHLAAEN